MQTNFSTDTSTIFYDKELICNLIPSDDRDTQWKFTLTDSTILLTLHWFHAMLGHPGIFHRPSITNLERFSNHVATFF